MAIPPFSPIFPTPSPEPALSPTNSSFLDQAYTGKFVKLRIHSKRGRVEKIDGRRAHILTSLTGKVPAFMKSESKWANLRELKHELEVSDLVLTPHPEDPQGRFFQAEIKTMNIRSKPDKIKVAWIPIEGKAEIGYIDKDNPEIPQMERIIPYNPNLVADRVSSIFKLKSGLELRGYSA